MPFGLGTGFGIGVELPLSELELELNCKNGIDPSSVRRPPFTCTCPQMELCVSTTYNFALAGSMDFRISNLSFFTPHLFSKHIQWNVVVKKCRHSVGIFQNNVLVKLAFLEDAKTISTFYVLRFCLAGLRNNCKVKNNN